MNDIATPSFKSTGFQNKEDVVATTETNIPAHLPLLFLLTNKGTEEINILPSDQVAREYGLSSFDEVSPCYTHQTKLASTIIANNSAVAIKRVTLPNSSKSIIRLAVEIVPAMVQSYQRDEQGKIVYTKINGISVPASAGLVSGTRVIWHSDNNLNVKHEFGKGVVLQNYRQGNIWSDKNGYLSGKIIAPGEWEYNNTTLYPIMDIEMKDVGSGGNNIGFVLDKLVDNVSFGLDYSLVQALKTMLYRIRIVEKNQTSYRVLRNSANDSFIKASFNRNELDSTNNHLFIGTALDSYVNNETNVLSYNKPIGKVHVYDANIVHVQNLLYNGYDHNGEEHLGESEFSKVFVDNVEVSDKLFNSPQMLDIFKGTDIDGNPYNSFTVISDDYDGIAFNEGRPIYGYGGSDGYTYTSEGTYDYLEILADYDREVRRWFSEEARFNLKDKARYPISAIWDSGYSLETKKAIISTLGIRSDIVLYLSTFTQAEFKLVGEGPGIDVRPIISCNGAQQDVVIRFPYSVTANYLFQLEIDGRVVGSELDENALVNLLISNGLAVQRLLEPSNTP